MDVVERLTLEAAQADTVIACEHRQRYQFAAGLCAGRRVLDLCCGSGYGSAILAPAAQEVVGVDNDTAAVDAAQATVGREHSNVSFQAADAVAFLRGGIPERFDDLVCFEGLEHLHELDEALRLLSKHADGGLRIVASIPNGKLFGEQNPFHVTEFGYDEALAAFAGFPRTVMVPQFLAEGSLICPPEATETDVTLSLQDRDEPEYANHFIFCVNFTPAEVEGVHHGHINLNTAPIFNRWSEGLKHANAALRRENARLARDRLGKGDSAAASALAALLRREEQVKLYEERLRLSQARVEELELALRSGGAAAGTEVETDAPTTAVEDIVLVPPGGRLAADGGDPSSWDLRRRRAEEVLIPWIEQSAPLAGRTVLEYGCGDGAVSSAAATRAGQLIGVDTDQHAIDEGARRLRDQGLANVSLELHSAEAIGPAVAARAGEVDVFMLHAALERMTATEQLAVLRLARDVVKPEGVIVVCEARNRLTGGPGVSFQEFEAVFGQRLDQHVLASNYDPLLFPERPVQPDEVTVARSLGRSRPDLPPVFSRYWLDLILSPQPIRKRPAFLRPWTAQTLDSLRVGLTERESLQLAGREAVLWITPPHPTTRLVFALAAGGDPLELRLSSPELQSTLSASIPPSPGNQALVSFPLPDPTQRAALRADPDCEVLLVLYEE